MKQRPFISSLALALGVTIAFAGFSWAQEALPAAQEDALSSEAGSTLEAGEGELLALAAELVEEQGDPAAPIAKALVRVRSVYQAPSFAQPWQRNPPQRRSSLGIALEGGLILTTAQAVYRSSFVELQAASGGGRVDAQIEAIDQELNLALLKPKQDAAFLSELKAVELAAEVSPDDSVELWQLEGTGEFSKTEGIIDRGAMITYPGSLSLENLAAEIRITVRTRPNSQSAPFVKDGKLAGLMMGYENRQQTARMLPVDLIKQFLNDLEDGNYQGRPSFVINWSQTEERNLRQWLGLSPDMGGVFVNQIAAEAGAKESGLEVGDVLLAINNEPIDARGFVQVEPWGKIEFTYLIFNAQSAGEEMRLSVWRDKELKELQFKPKRVNPWDLIVPIDLDNRGPNYLVLGGAVLQELTVPYMSEVGQIGDAQALEISRIIEDPSQWREDYQSVVLWCYTIPTPATFGYEALNHLIIEKVNGQVAANLQAVADAIAATPAGELIEFEVRGEPNKLYLDPELVNQVNLSLAEQGLVPLQRIEPY